MRFVPLTFSPLPFNIDGFPLARIADQMTASGAWQIEETDVNSYNQKMPALSLLWSAMGQLAALHPLTDLQWFLPIVTSTTVLSGYLLGAKLTGHRSVGFVAGFFLAVFGSFLFLTSAIMKEALGLVVLPMVVLLFHERSDPRKRALAVVLLLVLPFLHHLTSLMALGMATSLVVLRQRRDLRVGAFSRRRLALDLLTGPGVALPAVAYYTAVEMPFLEDVTRIEDIGLFLALAVFLAALGSGLGRPARVRIGRRLVSPAPRVLLIPAIAFGGLFLNSRTSVFAGAAGTQPALLTIVLPGIAILVGFALVGYQLVRRTSNRANDLLVAMLAAPTALILYGFLRGLDPLSLAIVYRAVDFMDYALAALVGVGFVFLWRAAGNPRITRSILAIGLSAALLASVPMAWESPSVFGVENVTSPEEFQALRVLASVSPGNATSDQRLADVAAWWFGLSVDPSLPIRIRDGASLEGYDYALLSERWTLAGAQVHPAPNVVLESVDLDNFLASHRVIYAGGDPGGRLFVVQLLTEIRL